MVRIFETPVLSVSFKGKIISLFLVFLNQYINKSMTLHNIYEKAWIVIASVILLLTCLHRRYALGLIKYYHQSEEVDNVVVDSWKRIRYLERNV